MLWWLGGGGGEENVMLSMPGGEGSNEDMLTFTNGKYFWLS